MHDSCTLEYHIIKIIFIYIYTACVIGEGHPDIEKLTFSQLKSKVSAWAAALKNSGIQKGDVVAGVLPNGVEVRINHLLLILIYR